MIGYEKSRCCVETFYCTDSIWSANKVKGKRRQRNISSSWIFDLPCDVKLRTLLRMSNKSNSFESDLLYFQKGPVPNKRWLYLNVSRVHANLNIFVVWSETDVLVSISSTVFSCPWVAAGISRHNGILFANACVMILPLTFETSRCVFAISCDVWFFETNKTPPLFEKQAFSSLNVGDNVTTHRGMWLVTIRLRVVPHFSTVIVEQAKRERAWKSPHARKGDTRRGWLSA